MNTSTIFNASNKLSDYKISVNDLVIDRETVITSELSYAHNSLKITGILTVKDVFDLNSITDWSTTIINIYYIDIFGESFDGNFKIIALSESVLDNNDKAITFLLQDTFSYILEHSYLSKSFNSNVIDAFTAYTRELGLTEYTLENGTISTNSTFVVPNHINNLEWFESEFNKRGLKFYRTKSAVVVKPSNDLLPASLIENDPDHVYTDETDNQLYKNKIYELKVEHGDRRNLPDISKSLSYSPAKKVINSFEANGINDLLLNDNTKNLQETSGKHEIYRQHEDTNEHLSFMRESFTDVNNITMIVNGYIKNDLHQIYNLTLRGNKGIVDSQNRGNSTISGKWISYKITDKLVGDSLVQKIMLKRADMSKP